MFFKNSNKTLVPFTAHRTFSPVKLKPARKGKDQQSLFIKDMDKIIRLKLIKPKI